MKRNLPHIPGYKPATNYQKALVPAVDDYLAAHPELYLLFEEDSRIVPDIPSVSDFLSRLESPPLRSVVSEVKESRVLYVPAQVDYLAMEASNALLGKV